MNGLQIVNNLFQYELNIRYVPSRVERTYSLGRNDNKYYSVVMRTSDGSVFVGGGEERKLIKFNKDLQLVA